MSDPNRYLVIDVTAPRATRRTLRARTQPLLLSLRRSAGDRIRKQAWSEPLEHADRSGSVQSRGIIILVSGVRSPSSATKFHIYNQSLTPYFPPDISLASRSGVPFWVPERSARVRNSPRLS